MTAFASAASYYARYRPGYPEEVFDLIADRFQLNGTQTALDLGCGTGAVTLPLTPHVARVLAVDPEPAMLAQGARAAAERGIDTVEWIPGDSTTLGAMGLPPVAVCTMGKSFHWMNQAQTLADLDKVITAEGGLALISGAAGGSRPPWLDVIEGVAAHYLGARYRQEHGPAAHPADGRDRTLTDSAFSQVETTTWEQQTSRTVDELVGLQLSFSYSSPAVLGERTNDFTRDLRTALLDFDPAGLFTNTVWIECAIARRP